MSALDAVGITSIASRECEERSARRFMKARNKPHFTAKQVERMRHLKADGMPGYEIARLFNVHANTVNAYLRGERKPVEK
jgi:DNA-binding CsgD family transcriptional regulator